MIEFSHVIQDPAGLHARPVTELCAEALKWKASVSVACEAATADARDLLQLMALGAHCGDTLRVRVEGVDEQEAAERLETLLEGF